MSASNNMIPARNARALVKAGKARCESLVYDEHRGRTYMAISNLDAQMTQHYLIGEGRVAADQLSAADSAIYGEPQT